MSEQKNHKKESEEKKHERKKSETCDDGFTLDLHLLKKIKWSYVILAIIILIGFYGTFFLPNSMKTPGRVYHLDFPSIGYHNMKENEYLSQALNQWKYGDYFRRRMHIFGLDPGPGYFEEYPQPPLLPWMFIGMWSVFGVQFWSARLIMVLFSAATIPFLYLLVKRLTKNNEYIALTSAFIYSVLPLAVFFGRNIQPEAPALFFLVLGMYFYTKWTDELKTKNIIYSGLALMMCAMFKPTFLIGMIPMLFIFPFSEFFSKFTASKSRQQETAEQKKEEPARERKDKKEGKKEFPAERKKAILQIVYFGACFIPYFVWNWISANILNTQQQLFEGTLHRVQLFRIFTTKYWAEYWPTLNAYMRDNYAVWFLWLAAIGFAFMLLKYRTKLSRFCIGYAIALIPYGMLLADYIKGHSYYQMPFVPLICIAAAYSIYTLGMFIKQLTKIKHTQYIALALLLFALPSARAFTNVQYDTIFFGLDVGGNYIKTNTASYERFFMEGESQTVGVCYGADRRCAGISNATDLQMAETQLNFTMGFIHITGGGLYNLYQKPEMLNYIQKNYRIAQIGVIPQQNGQQQSLAPYYIILKKGGASDLQNIANNKVAEKQPVLAKTYDTTHGTVPFYTISE